MRRSISEILCPTSSSRRSIRNSQNAAFGLIQRARDLPKSTRWKKSN
jgi:hypothetical protein